MPADTQLGAVSYAATRQFRDGGRLEKKFVAVA
jgi:hypothetical protein